MIVSFDIWDSELITKIERLKSDPHDVTHIIINSAIEFQYDHLSGEKYVMDELVEFTKNQNIKLDIITGTHPNYVLMPAHSNVKINYWPTFWLTMLLTRLKVSPNYQINMAIGMNVNDIETGKNIPLKYPFISMNKAPKVHRALMMDMLSKFELLDKGVVIWRELSNNYPFQYWNQKIMLRDQIDRFVYQEMLPLEYSTSFAQLVPESDEIIFTMSEKTGMALYFNKPFLVAGCKNFHHILKEFGFVWYDEIFDYAFDTVDDINLRYSMIAENFANLSKYSIPELKELKKRLFDKCVHNKKVALNLATSTKLVPDIWQVLVDHQVQNNIGSYPETINNFIKQHEAEFKF